MTRRDLLKMSGAAASAELSLATVGGAERRPNFLFMIADDLTYRGVHALGNSEIQTPNLDRLVRRGCAFTHCFHQGSWLPAVCVASRTMLNTGLTAFRAHKNSETAPLWGQTLGAAGYDSCIVGKWHLSQANLDRGFRQTGPISGGMFESGPESLQSSASRRHVKTVGYIPLRPMATYRQMAECQDR
jgi:arylsulfatase A-like enzyme